MKRLNSALILMMLGVILLATGCGSDDDDTLSLEGTWRFTSASVDGVPVSLSEAIFEETDSTKGTITFEANGSAIYKEYGPGSHLMDTDNGTYTVSGSSVTIVIYDDDGDADTIIANWSLDGDVLSLNFSDNGESIIILLSRE
jgi:hypothetical protein